MNRTRISIVSGVALAALLITAHLAASGRLTASTPIQQCINACGDICGPDQSSIPTKGKIYCSHCRTGDEKKMSVCGNGQCEQGETTASCAQDCSEVACGDITEFDLPPGSGPVDIVAGPDASLWFTEASANKIGKLTAAGVLTEFPLADGSYPEGIAIGPDGNIWFTEFTTDKIGRMTPTGGVKEFSISRGCGPVKIDAAVDGRLWFTCINLNQVGSITTEGVVNEESIAGHPDVGLEPYGITHDPDGSMWFTTLNTAPAITRIAPNGTMTEHALATWAMPNGIAWGPDHIWFTFGGVNLSKIDRMDRNGGIEEFPTPTAGSGPSSLTRFSDGNLLFTENLVDQIGIIAGDGHITECVLPHREAGANDIVEGPEGNAWFTEFKANKIGRMTIAH